MTKTTTIAAAVVLIIAVAAVAAIIIIQQSQIADTTRNRDHLQSELTTEQETTAALRTDLAAEQQARADVEDELADTQADLTTEQQARADVEDELTDTQADLTAEQQAKAFVEDELADTQADLTTEQQAKADVEDELADEQVARADAEEQLADTQADLTAEQRRANAAESRATTIAAELQTLQDAVGALESIQAEIRRLEEERRPLIPDRHSYSPRCTGSMEPVITCLDNVTLLNNIDLEDVVVGAVVDVTLADGSGVLHRIIEIKDGQVLTQGDNNRKHDGWVPLNNVERYMIGLDKNANPGDAWLRERFNTADAEYESAAKRYCGGLDKVARCSTSEANFRKVYGAWCRYTYLLEQASPEEWDPRKPDCARYYESAATSDSIHYGPVSGELPHDDDDRIEVHYARLNVADFEAVTLLMNPYPETTGNWDYGFIFRQSERNIFHTLVLTSGGRWFHRLRTGSAADTTNLASGTIRRWNLDDDEYFFTQLRLVVKGDTGWLYINGYAEATLDLSAGPSSGDVGVMSGYFTGYAIAGSTTPFSEFVIYDTSQPADIPPTS